MAHLTFARPHETFLPMHNFVQLAIAAERLGVTPKTVRRWIDAGHLPAARTPGGHYLIDVADLDAFIESLTVNAPASAS